MLDIQLRSILEPKYRPKTSVTAMQPTKSYISKLRQELQLYREPAVYKPFIILLLIFLFQQLSGAYVIIFYAIDLFRKIDGNIVKGIDEYVALILLGLIRFGMALISAFISKRVGRRPLLFVSGIGMCISSLIAGLYMYLTLVPPEAFAKLHISKPANSFNITLICLLGYVCLSSIGYLVIPWTLIGELLPVKVRGKLGGFLIAIAYVMMFGAVKGFPYLLEVVEIQWVFCVFSVINICGVCFIFFFLPETLGKSFGEIEMYFQQND